MTPPAQPSDLTVLPDASTGVLRLLASVTTESQQGIVVDGSFQSNRPKEHDRRHAHQPAPNAGGLRVSPLGGEV